jgi:hypothetical protein
MRLTKAQITVRIDIRIAAKTSPNQSEKQVGGDFIKRRLKTGSAAGVKLRSME